MDKEMSQEAVVSKVQSGFGDGPFFKTPNLAPTMTVVEGFDPLAVRAVQGASFPQPTPDDTWFKRRGSK